MADQTLNVVRENEIAAAGCQSTPSEEELREHRDYIGISDYSDDTRLSSTDEEPKLPILKKIDIVEAIIKKLRKEQTTIIKEVKDFTSNKFPGSEVFNALNQICADHELMKKHHEEYGVLKKKYFQECAERKRLYNEVIELKGNIRVFCRCRPLNRDEITSGCTSHVEFDSTQENKLQITCADLSKKEFKFDHVFGPEDTQEAVFGQTSPIVTSVLDGYNVCIFSYGQTGTGKTFTMEGTIKNRGVNYRTLEELFRISNERSNKMRYELFVSMLEVYNEKTRDLLAKNSSHPTQKLEIKQAADGSQEVPGLIEVCVSSTNEVWEILKRGNQARSIGSTNANEYSSRSHCLLRVTVKGEELANNMRTKSKLWLVDLAGCERVGKTEAEGERLKESQFINKSLSALGDVISALASKATHVPFRNSILTHILQSSLGRDCKTLMFVQISPSCSDLGETLCSLNFASRVRGIEYGPAQKHVDHSELLKYKQMAEKVKHDEKEMKKLQDSVQSLQLRLSAKEHVSRSLQEKLKQDEKELKKLRDSVQSLQLRLSIKEHVSRRSLQNKAEKVKHDEKEMKKLLDSVQSLQLRLSAKEHVSRSLQEKVQQDEKEMKKLGDSVQSLQLRLSMKEHVSRSSLQNKAEKVKHDEKEMKNLPDSVQSLQLRLSAKEQVSRSLQEKLKQDEKEMKKLRDSVQSLQLRLSIKEHASRRSLQNKVPYFENQPGTINASSLVPSKPPLLNKPRRFTSCNIQQTVMMMQPRRIMLPSKLTSANQNKAARNLWGRILKQI